MSRLVTLIAMITFAFAVTACNTVKGFGRDVGAAGRAVEDAADDTEEAIDGD